MAWRPARRSGGNRLAVQKREENLSVFRRLLLPSPPWFVAQGKEPLKTVVGPKLMQGEINLPVAHQRQGREVLPRLGCVETLQHDDRVSVSGGEPNIADDAALHQVPNRFSFLAKQVREDGQGRRGSFSFNGEDAHGVPFGVT